MLNLFQQIINQERRTIVRYLLYTQMNLLWTYIMIGLQKSLKIPLNQFENETCDLHSSKHYLKMLLINSDKRGSINTNLTRLMYVNG